MIHRREQSADTIEYLEAEHRRLETELAELLRHPGASDEEIAAIKRQKLNIKDRVARLVTNGRSFTPQAEGMS